MEIHSAWGTFEWLLYDALDMGYRVGIVCNSDDHKGRPGASYPGASTFGAYGGLTCLLLPELTRAAAIDCLRRRHHYGTTGNRMVLDVRCRFDNSAELFDEDPALGPTSSHRVREAMMGDILRNAGRDITLMVRVLGSAPIERVELRRGREVLETLRPYATPTQSRRLRVIWEGAEYRGRGRQTIWDGSATVRDNSITEVGRINFWNPDKSIDREGDYLEWEALTTGNFGGFDLFLRDPDAGRLEVLTEHASLDLPISEIGVEPVVCEAGGLARKLSVRRLPEQLSRAQGRSRTAPAARCVGRLAILCLGRATRRLSGLVEPDLPDPLNRGESMDLTSRRGFLKAAGIGAFGAAIGARPLAAQAKSLTLLHESSFIKTFDEYMQKTLAPAYEKETGVKINYELTSVGSLPTRISTIAETGSGADITMNSCSTRSCSPRNIGCQRHRRGGREKAGRLVRCRQGSRYCQRKWKAMPFSNIGQLMNWRTDWFAEVGVKKFPETWEELYEVGKKLKAKDHPFGFELGHGFGDNHGWLYPLLWSYGGARGRGRRQDRRHRFRRDRAGCRFRPQVLQGHDVR